MQTAFQRIILYARHHRATAYVTESLQRIVTFLASLKLETVLAPETASSFPMPLPVVAKEEMDETRDLIVVVGGDGSLLSAARMAIEVKVPIIGINRGTLGFLTDISPEHIEQQLGPVLEGSYQEEDRFLLEAHIYNGRRIYYHSLALNDVVLGRGDATQLIDFNVYIDNQYVSHYRSDGMIVSTPTGSTAYALSAGGPIMHPKLNAIVLVPMFSHSLSSRPLVVDAKATIDLTISFFNESDLRLSCDGHESHLVKPGQKVRILKAAQALRLLHPKDYHYYDTLRIKLGWEFRGNSN